MKSLEDFADEESDRQTIERLSRQLHQARKHNTEINASVQRAITDGLKGLRIKPVTPPRKDIRKRHNEIAVPLFSDLQLGKVTPEYNSERAEEVIEIYGDKIVGLANVQRTDHPVRRCHIPFLGDIVEGEIVFPGQHWLIDSSLYRQATVDGPRILTNFIRRMLSTFEEVEVTCVIGNHGRLGRPGQYEPESNADRMVYQIVKQIMEASGERRVKFNIPDGAGERNWYAIVREGNYSALAIHGDQIRGHSGFPWYGLGKKVNSWASGSIPETFQDVFMGHWHQIGSIPLNTRNVFVNGSTESYNTYAQENLAAMSKPAQWLLFVNPVAGQVTAEYKVWL